MSCGMRISCSLPLSVGTVVPCSGRPALSFLTLVPPARQASHKGLTTTEAADRIKIYGYNKLPEETRNPILVSIPAVRGGALALHE